MDAHEIILILAGCVVGVLGYLLKQRDDKQAEELKAGKAAHDKHVEDVKKGFTDLYKLHADDVAKLAALEVEIAKNHYPKPELDERFRQLDTTIKEGFRDLGNDIREMTKALQSHLQEHSTNRGQ